MQRRTVLKGAAWSIPVIAAAVAVPFAATTTPASSVGSLVESSDNIKDTTLSASSSRVEACFPEDNFLNVPFVLTATIVYSGSLDEFSLENAGLRSDVTAWTVTSTSKNTVQLTSTQSVSCYAGIAGFEVLYNTQGVKPELNSIHLNISGVSTDGTRKIDGLVSALHGYGPVVGPRVHDN